MNELIAELPDHIFTGLSTKARVTVTGSACWEHSRSEGGTAQAILDLMTEFRDQPVPIRDLWTGKITDYSQIEQFDSTGTAIFWACLDKVLQTPREELSEVSLTIVKEPGKARVVTKGHAALKIVLDTVSKLVSEPLKKGFTSSQSGMGKSHHGWNLFKDLFSEEMESLIFNEKYREEDTYTDHVQRLQVWEDVYLSSTDYQEATDRMVHHFGRIVAAKWLRKCGIPPLLSGIVMGVCLQPRRIYFTGIGPLSNIGTEFDGPIRYVTLKRGVLMGDPLTKVILHFANIISRRIGQGLTDATIFRHFRNGYEGAQAFHEGMRANSN
jgi:hypothetical protein